MRALLFAVTLALAVPATALAQDPPPPPAEPPPPPPPPPEAPPRTYTRQDFELAVDRQRFGEYLTEQSRSTARRSRERKRRAELLASMANSGQCREAIYLARQAGDEQMAMHLSDACRAAPPTSSPD